MLAYRQMGYSPSTLENLGRLLFGFNGATTTSLCDVVLIVQAGPVTLSMWLSMVNDWSPYNAIIGHAWLHKMKFIPSMYHQMVSYLTEGRQVNLLSSQLVVRRYYKVALEFKHPANEEAHLNSSNTREQKQLLGPAEKDPSAANLLQPLLLSHNTDQITYTSSLLA